MRLAGQLARRQLALHQCADDAQPPSVGDCSQEIGRTFRRFILSVEQIHHESNPRLRFKLYEMLN